MTEGVKYLYDWKHTGTADPHKVDPASLFKKFADIVSHVKILLFRGMQPIIIHFIYYIT